MSGKSVVSALDELRFMKKRATAPLIKLLNSAVANAKHNFSLNPEKLYIKEARVNQGKTLKRSMPHAFGRAFPINKRTSHITVILGEREQSAEPTVSQKNSTTDNKIKAQS